MAPRHVTEDATKLPSSSTGTNTSTRPVTGTLRNNADEDQEMHYSLMEEEFQVQLALALSASSNTDDIIGARGEIGGAHVESCQIGAAPAVQDSGDDISHRYWGSLIKEYGQGVRRLRFMISHAHNSF